MAYEPPKKKEGFFDSIGIFGQILILIIASVIGAVIIFGFNLGNLPQFFLNILIVGAGLFCIFLIIKGAMSYLEPKAYSPSGDFKTKIVNIATKLKNPNVHNLWLRGEGYVGRALVGQILGFAFLPYLVSEELKDDKGRIIYLKDPKGEFLKDAKDNLIPKRQLISSKDGDLLFVLKQGMFGLGKPMLIRCHRNLCNPKLVGDIYITDVGFMPYGDYYYPSSQWQSTIREIMNQCELETIAQTHSAFLDLVADTTRMSIGADPTFQKLLSLRDERLASTPVGAGIPAGGYR